MHCDAKILPRNLSFVWHPQCLPGPINDEYPSPPNSASLRSTVRQFGHEESPISQTPLSERVLFI